jgi:hypothetical protein
MTLALLGLVVLGVVIAVAIIVGVYVMVSDCFRSSFALSYSSLLNSVCLFDVQLALLAATFFFGFLGFIVLRFFQNNYILSFRLQVSALVSFSLVVVFGVILGLVVDQPSLAFWSYSASWHVITLVLVGSAAAVEQQVGGGGAPTVYSPHVFPVYQFDLRADDVKLSNAPTAMRYLALGLWFSWCVVTAVNGSQSIGLGCSALGVVVLYVYTRFCTLAASDRLAGVALFLTADVIRKARTVRCGHFALAYFYALTCHIVCCLCGGAGCSFEADGWYCVFTE